MTITVYVPYIFLAAPILWKAEGFSCGVRRHFSRLVNLLCESEGFSARIRREKQAMHAPCERLPVCTVHIMWRKMLNLVYFLIDVRNVCIAGEVFYLSV